MTNEDSSSQLNLTVVALVALVAIVGLVALVMNAVSVKTLPIATGSKLATAQTTTTGQNLAGNAGYAVPPAGQGYTGTLKYAGMTYQLSLDTTANTLHIGPPGNQGFTVPLTKTDAGYTGALTFPGITIPVEIDMTLKTAKFTFSTTATATLQ